MWRQTRAAARRGQERRNRMRKGHGSWVTSGPASTRPSGEGSKVPFVGQRLRFFPMRSTMLRTFVLAAVVAAGGCAATVASDGYGPDLVTVSPGVQVIADYDEPIFYS